MSSAISTAFFIRAAPHADKGNGTTAPWICRVFIWRQNAQECLTRVRLTSRRFGAAGEEMMFDLIFIDPSFCSNSSDDDTQRDHRWRDCLLRAVMTFSNNKRVASVAIHYLVRDRKALNGAKTLPGLPNARITTAG